MENGSRFDSFSVRPLALRQPAGMQLSGTEREVGCIPAGMPFCSLVPAESEVVHMATAKQRLQFDFNKESLKQLDALREATGLSNRAELIRYALRFFHWMHIELVEKKATLLLERDGKQFEVAFPFWGP